MKPIMLTAAAVLAAAVVIPAWNTPAVATAPLITSMAQGERCHPTDESHFQYRNGAIVIKRDPGIDYRVVDESGADVTSRIASLPSGTYVVTFATSAGSVVNVMEIPATKPCGDPPTRVKVGPWKVQHRTAHKIFASRSVKTTRYRAVIVATDGGANGTWEPNVTIGSQDAVLKV